MSRRRRPRPRRQRRRDGPGDNAAVALFSLLTFLCLIPLYVLFGRRG